MNAADIACRIKRSLKAHDGGWVHRVKESEFLLATVVTPRSLLCNEALRHLEEAAGH